MIYVLIQDTDHVIKAFYEGMDLETVKNLLQGRTYQVVDKDRFDAEPDYQGRNK